MTLVGLMLSMADPPEIEIIHKAQNVDIQPSFLSFCQQFPSGIFIKRVNTRCQDQQWVYAADLAGWARGESCLCMR